MLRLVLALVMAGSMVLGGPHTPAHAADISDNPECQQMFERLAQPLMQQLLWFTSVANQSPLTPRGRPIVTGWPYSAYGPGNGYGPGSPYGPTFGPWGVGAYGPGAGGPLGYGLGPTGVGGPGWQFARAQVANSVAGLNAAPPGLSFLAVAAGVNAQTPGLGLVGGLGGPGTSDLIALAALQQGEIGNVFAAAGLQQSQIANRVAGAGLAQSVVGNRLAAAGLNATLADFPLNQADHLSSAIGAIQTYVSNTCPRAVPEDGQSGAGP
ncbi:MAG TPA: hypothetical protein VFE37_09090 [Chloroflexota bacterium]|nr:hypothetical protein [Chloroflexota bacterium]